MELNLIEELAGVMARTSIEELEYSRSDVRIRLQRSATGRSLAAETRQASGEAAVIPATAAVSKASPSPTPSSPLSLHSVVAGMSGTFFSAPAPDKAPFVKVGDIVQEGQVLAVVEAMKMLNQIEADASGRIVRVAVEDGATVTPATVLFEITPQEERP
ncbi:acetyl-CoA carboxylase biotin carboxyl carrier protein [Comamonas sp. BIGb0152]|uniref:acetyl-CoA carboxylase biotin carboxyl carrier protein n=1 Tax=Comamonas sp. BIGb0152 TaxID=2940601 RepID=UPI00216A9F8F|nr:acetyl-CoA carboxylase biotin carboxyl carrier protein [Comamonas sp. BIGb0152]MCS4296273.1 acetyl-CoA carboxylase biotin carboxyl carrier protein [Comamonas sp. BIGb0152]